MNGGLLRARDHGAGDRMVDERQLSLLPFRAHFELVLADLQSAQQGEERVRFLRRAKRRLDVAPIEPDRYLIGLPYRTPRCRAS